MAQQVYGGETESSRGLSGFSNHIDCRQLVFGLFASFNGS